MGLSLSGNGRANNNNIKGYQILRIIEKSPAQNAGLEAFFDFIVSIFDEPLNGLHDDLQEFLNENVRKPFSVKVYSSRTDQYKDVTVIPDPFWGRSNYGLFGTTVRFCSVSDAFSTVQRVLEVQAGSAAQKADLRARVDYIFGAEMIKKPNEFDVSRLFEFQLELFVYNIETKACRSVILPNTLWTNIGCSIANEFPYHIPFKDSSLNPYTLVCGTVNTILDIASNAHNLLTTVHFFPPIPTSIDCEEANKEGIPEHVIDSQPTRSTYCTKDPNLKDLIAEKRISDVFIFCDQFDC